MKRTELLNFLAIMNGKILLPIDEYVFSLSKGSAENMIVALRGALDRLEKEKCTHPRSFRLPSGRLYCPRCDDYV